MDSLQQKGGAYEALCARLREARKQAGLTQEDVARLLNRPQSFVSKFETGERRLDVVELALIARIYGKDLTYFEEVIE